MQKGNTGLKYVQTFINSRRRNSFKRQPHKIVKHTQTICRQFADELGVFDHFVGLVLKRLNRHEKKILILVLMLILSVKSGVSKKRKLTVFDNSLPDSMIRSKDGIISVDKRNVITSGSSV